MLKILYLYTGTMSPFRLMERIGVGGQLVPFFKCVVLYFALGAATAPSITTAAAKCAPVFCLLVFVVPRATTDHTRGWYARRVAAGLALSCLGDALLVWPQYFVAGMAAFGGAHVAYVLAFQFRPVAALRGLVCYAATASYLTLLEPPAALRALVPLYATLLATMAWRAAAAPRPASTGALLFLLSDALLGYSLFADTFPYKQVLVMSTYYLGQLAIALSALQTPHSIKKQLQRASGDSYRSSEVIS